MSRLWRLLRFDPIRSSQILRMFIHGVSWTLAVTGCVSGHEQRLCAEILTHVREAYVDPVDEQSLLYSGIQGMLEALDPYSAFLPPDVFRAVQEDAHDHFGGVGIELDQRHGALIVVAALPGTPAAAADIRAGDCLLAVDGKSVAGLDRTVVAARLHGVPGTAVTLTLRRVPSADPVEIRLLRENIRLANVQAQQLDDDYGYVRLIQFRDSAEADMKTALAMLRTRSLRPLAGLILDLRDNPGGRFDQAVKVADLFLERGLIVHTVGHGADNRVNYMAHQHGTETDVPMVVLINGGTASSAEIVAGALRDHHRARLLGTRSYGKGTMQKLIPLADGSGLRLTTARYFTPGGFSIDEVGLVPDEDVPMADGLQATDLQLQRALEYLKGIHPSGISLSAAE